MKSPKMRRSVSFAAVTYVRMWLHCHRHNVAMAAWLDRLATDELDRCDAATPTQREAYAAIQSIREAKKLKGQPAKLKRVLVGIQRAAFARQQTAMAARPPGEFHSGNGHLL